MGRKEDYNILIKKDGRFYTGYCLEIPQARGQGDTKQGGSYRYQKSDSIMQILS